MCAVTAKVGDIHEDVEPTVLPSLGIGAIQQAQRKDPVLGRIWYYIDREHEPARREKRKEPPAVAKLLQQWDRLQLFVAVVGGGEESAGNRVQGTFSASCSTPMTWQ